MKKFKTNTSVIIGIAIVAFVLNIFYLCSLYLSIAEDVKREVKAAMAYMNVDELWQRAIVYSKNDNVPHGTMNSSLQAGSATIVTKESDNQGKEREVNRRRLVQAEPFTNQMMTEMSDQMHRQMDGLLPMNIADADSILRCRLSERGIYPEFVAVEVVDSFGKIIVANPRMDSVHSDFDMFQMPYGAERYYSYRVYITPLMKQILHEMAGVISTTFILIVTFAIGFWYLLYTVAKLRSIEEMKDDFVGNMTHELKTPIAIAYSANDALLNYDTSNDPEKKTAYLNIAVKQLKRLGELVENILAMSMERRKAMTLKQEQINLYELAFEIAEAQKMSGNKEIAIEVESDGDVTVTADKSHLSNVLNNLIDNAIKYSGDSVSINIHIDSDSIAVSDNGIGIPSKSLPFIFDKFYRVPHGNRQDVRGYGIGLYYVKRIIEKMGWSISVKSREGHGSTFTINFKGHES